MDKIIIKGLNVMAKHGVNPEEKSNTQLFIVDCKIFVKKSQSFFSDNLDDTINYSQVCKKIKEVTQNSCFNLIERLAEEIAKNLFECFDDIHKIRLVLKKPDAPMNFVRFNYVGVSIERRRKNYNV